MSGLKTGDAAPDLTLPSETGASVQLSTLWAKGPVVVFFYPADHSYGCTKEVCRFRDGYEDFTAAGAAAIVGISKDGQASHESFKQKQRLPFTLLSDEKGEAVKAFKVKKQLFGLVPGRVTFVIDQSGKIAHVFSSAMDFGGHVDKAKEVVKNLSKGGPSASTTSGSAAQPATTPAPTATTSAADPAPAAGSAVAPAAVGTDAPAVSAGKAEQEAAAAPQPAGA